MTSYLIENILINISFGLLLISLIVYWSHLAFNKWQILVLIGQTLTFIINLSLAITLSIRWIYSGYFPLSNLYESLIFLTWCFTFIQIVLEYQNKNKKQIIGAISIPISLFTIAFASFALPTNMQQASPLVPALRSNWLMMHVSIMMLSYSILIIGCLLSILFLIISRGQNVNLKYNNYNYSISYDSNNTKGLFDKNKINILQSIDNLSYRTIGLGFPLLTIGIIAGAVWANEAWGSYWSWDPKETWALITWLIFAAYLHSRLNKSWNGKKPAILATCGFIIVWICYLGVNFIGKGLHSYGWIL